MISQTVTNVTFPETRESISTVYQGSSKIFQLLRQTYWGPELMNFGYHPWYWGLGRLLNGLRSRAVSQRRLAYKAIALMGVESGDRVLDVACGRGGSSYMIHHSTPAASVNAIDLLQENIEIARRIFPAADTLNYQQGDAQNISFPDEMFHKVLCCEAAFHFPDRGEFLQEASRVLLPNGRLVVVDFVWRTPEHRVGRNHKYGKLVRDVWEWEDMSTESEYQSLATDAGLRAVRSEDWTNEVTRSLQLLAERVVWLQKRSWGRWVLSKKSPLLSSFTPEDWTQIQIEVAAHRFFMEHTYYKAMVFEKK